MVIEFGFPPVSEGEYYMISYNKADADRLRPIVKKLSDEGVPMWYDYGLEYGAEWRHQIAERISRAKGMIMFVTKGIFMKEDSYVLTEYDTAKFFEIPVIPVCIDIIDSKSVTPNNVSWWLDIRKLHCIEFPTGTDANRVAAEIRVALRYICPSSSLKNTEVREVAARPSAPQRTQAPVLRQSIPTIQPEPPREPAKIEPADEAPAVTGVGSCIKLGRYPQNASVPEPIEWIILSMENGQAMVISKYALDAVCYNPVHAGVTWESSYLHQWLNRDFMSQAFTAAEAARIKQVRLGNADNEQFGTTGGNAVIDRVFSLSVDEVKMYLPTSKQRVCHPTPHAVRKGAEKSEADRYGTTWWLRSPGFYGANAAAVMFDGELRAHGIGVTNSRIAVRPAMIISL